MHCIAYLGLQLNWLTSPTATFKQQWNSLTAILHKGHRRMEKGKDQWLFKGDEEMSESTQRQCLCMPCLPSSDEYRQHSRSVSTGIVPHSAVHMGMYKRTPHMLCPPWAAFRPASSAAAAAPPSSPPPPPSSSSLPSPPSPPLSRLLPVAYAEQGQ